MHKQKRKTRSVSTRLRILWTMLLPVVLVMLVISITVIDYTRNQSRQYLEDNVDFFVADISKTLSNVNRRMRALLLSSSQESLAAASYMQTIQTCENQALVNHSINQFKLMFNDYSLEYGADKHFFLYFAPKDLYVRGTDGSLSQRVYRRFERPLIDLLRHDQSLKRSAFQNWKAFQTSEGEYALVRMYRKNDIYMGCWILADDLVAPLNQMSLGKNGFVTLCNDQNEFLLNRDRSQELDVRANAGTDGAYLSRQSILGSQLIITRRLVGIPYKVKLFISNYGTFEQLLYVQMVILFLGVAVFVCLLGSVYYLQRRLLKPLRNFSRSIQQIEAGYGNIDSLSRSDLQELDKANAEFVKLLTEVERLKATVNMQKLEKQAIQMDYLKMQVKPHFYLNCLNFIYNMVDLGEYENAKQMCRVTSDYFRYLLRNGDALVTLAEEMNHVRDYMAIQKMRYENAVKFHMELEERALTIKLPPMIVQTFVENAIKHALNLEREVSIAVCVSWIAREGNDHVEISIQDNGMGFDSATLRQLTTHSGLRKANGHGIGIDNCMKRLYYYYGSCASVRFSNGHEGGALVQISLPSSPKNALEEGGNPLNDDLGRG